MNRRGFQLTEILVALALTAGPLLTTVHLVHTTFQGARFNQQQAVVRLVLLDILDAVTRTPVTTLVARRPERRGPWLDTILESRIRSPSTGPRQPGIDDMRDLSGHLCYRLDERAGGHTGLARLTLSFERDGGRTVSVARLVRVE